MRPRSSEEGFGGDFFRVEVERWDHADRPREIVRAMGAAAVVALTPDREVVLVRQLRESVRREILELPAGVRDVQGEPAAETAVRELREETGFRATSIRPLTRLLSSPGMTDEGIEVFVAEVEPDGEPEAGIEVVRIPLEAAVAMVERGEIEDAKTAAALLLAARLEGPR